MQVNLLYRHNLNKNRISDWVPTRLPKESNLGYRRLARSLMIDWTGYTGSADASITIYVTNNYRAKSKGRTITIDRPSNRDNAYLQFIDGRYAFIRVEFDRGSGSFGGNISATLYYD